MSYFIKKPCKNCPYRKDVKPYLTPERGEELAYHTQNPYNSFPCHKTTEFDEDDFGNEYVSNEPKECAGFMTMQIGEGMDCPECFTPSWELVYGDVYQMIDNYSEDNY
jgi:hypothetical protein